jgi:hypothetical protein
VTDDAPLPNIALAALHAREITWVPIRFLRRTAGASTVRPAVFARLGLALARDLWQRGR